MRPTEGIKIINEFGGGVMVKYVWFFRALSASVLLFFLSSCATSAKNVSASYVSPLAYDSYDCDQLRGEYIRVSQRVMEVSGQQDATAKKDVVAMSVGMVLFWPALFFLAGGDKSQELSRLKGESEAIESVAINKKCSIAAEIADIRRQKNEKEKKEQNERESAQSQSGVMR